MAVGESLRLTWSCGGVRKVGVIDGYGAGLGVLVL